MRGASGHCSCSADFQVCHIADFQSAERRRVQARENVRDVRRLEALRYGRLGNLRYGGCRDAARHAVMTSLPRDQEGITNGSSTLWLLRRVEASQSKNSSEIGRLRRQRHWNGMPTRNRPSQAAEFT
jgi:hypothetical protein